MSRTLIASTIGLALAATAAAAQTQQYRITVTPAGAPDGYGRLSIDKAVIGSSQIRIWENTSVEPDCTPRGRTTLTVVQPPRHGAVTISDTPFFHTFDPRSARGACSQHKVPGHQAFYTAEAGYTGGDKVVLEGSHPDGYVRRITINISVR